MSEDRDELILSVALKSGAFKTELRVPLPCDPAVSHKAVESWLELIQVGLKTGATQIDAVLPNKAEERS